MPIPIDLKVIFDKLLNSLKPEPTTWENFSRQLQTPGDYLGNRFAADVARFSNDPAYKDRLSSIVVKSQDFNHVFIRVSPTGVVDMAISSLDVGAKWQSKPDGTTYRGAGFRSIQQSGHDSEIEPLVMACFDDLAQNPEHASAIVRARAAYRLDSEIFYRDPGGLDNLIYKTDPISFGFGIKA